MRVHFFEDVLELLILRKDKHIWNALRLVSKVVVVRKKTCVLRLSILAVLLDEIRSMKRLHNSVMNRNFLLRQELNLDDLKMFVVLASTCCFSAVEVKK